ncbi:MAG: ribosome maturation factor RimM [Methylocystis sp.]
MKGPAKGLVLLGRFGAPHGVRGEIRLQSFTCDPQAIGTYDGLTDKNGARNFKLLSVRQQGKDMLVAKVAGVEDREGAEALNGVELYLPREKLPAPDEDEFYIADLVGLRAEAADGAPIGVIVAVRNFGAGDILEIAPAAGGESLLFPFTKATVPTVDIPGRRVVVEPPAEIEAERGEKKIGRRAF